MNPFSIKGNDIKKEHVGSPNRPYLYNIGPGQRNEASLIFDIKIGNDYRQLTIDKVNKSSVNLKCVSLRTSDCKARHKFKVKDEFVLVRENEGEDGSSKRKYPKYYLDFSNLELRNVNNWEVVENKTVEHNCKPTGFYSQIQRSVREAHTAASLLTLELV